MAKGFSTGHNTGIGKGSHANMPPDVQIRDYPKGSSYPGGDIDDTITGIDRVNSMTEKKASKHKSYQK